MRSYFLELFVLVSAILTTGLLSTFTYDIDILDGDIIYFFTFSALDFIISETPNLFAFYMISKSII